MSKRREGRETAIQLLFSRDFTPPGAMHEVEAFFEIHSAGPRIRQHAIELYEGVVTHLESIDRRLVASLENFSLERLAGVDRNILRLAIYEMFHRTDLEFHEILFEAMRFDRIHAILDNARANLDRARHMILGPRRLTETRAEHRAIFDAIVADDTDRAVAAMRQHIEQVTGELLEFARGAPELFADSERLNDLSLFD